MTQIKKHDIISFLLLIWLGVLPLHYILGTDAPSTLIFLLQPDWINPELKELTFHKDIDYSEPVEYLVQPVPDDEIKNFLIDKATDIWNE